MVAGKLSRRALLVGLAGLPTLLKAQSAIDLNWSDLLPEGTPFVPNGLQEFIDHTGPAMTFQQPASNGVRPEWGGKTVRLPGFVVPIEFDGTAVSTFLLVPFVGACVHVPPPPANQLVLVSPIRPFESGGLFEPVQVEGILGVATISTYLADVGYTMSDARIELYDL